MVGLKILKLTMRNISLSQAIKSLLDADHTWRRTAHHRNIATQSIPALKLFLFYNNHRGPSIAKYDCKPGKKFKHSIVL